MNWIPGDPPDTELHTPFVGTSRTTIARIGGEDIILPPLIFPKKTPKTELK
jgi:hypothetical protein